LPKKVRLFDKIKAIRVNDEILAKCPKTKKFSTWVKELILKEVNGKNEIFKRGFQELYTIFDEFSKNPSIKKANELFLAADLAVIDKAKEALTFE